MGTEPYAFVSEGSAQAADGTEVPFVTVLDDGHNPIEYAIPLSQAINDYGDRTVYTNPSEVP